MTSDYYVDNLRVDERTNAAAMLSLFGALVGLFPVAIVFGAIGYVEVGGRENERGSGIAVAGLLLGLLELIVLLTVPLILIYAR
ncbi:hypothetical protein CH296_27070 [Rhodococcus sp. 14-2496-1d]|uniref:hypothetical protein n=1 Tax=Rhodococcus sp. 14-2496-1d TaxID=2023146 RepID=UPI000B9BD72C|nr:hypothetical protein [Rhodococcus sp. 14-2496-1d]OZF25766.1 hypothetical protein CH296_27070 [Rhodococcus sp. 14-2496-1d]